MKRALVAGWFSFPDRKATFGDVEAMRVLCTWLDALPCAYDVAGHRANGVPGVDLLTVPPERYDVVLFVCGPWGPGARGPGSFLERFAHCTTIGLNLSLNGDSGLDHLLPRDAPGVANPDLVFGDVPTRLPLVGVMLVHDQPMFGDRQRHAHVRAVVDGVLARGLFAPVRLDTLLRDNPAGIESLAQLEALIRATEVVITTRLHGLVLALRNDVPAVAIDAVAGGDKVTHQARAVGWPLLLRGDDLTDDALLEAIARARTPEMRARARTSHETASTRVRDIRGRLFSILRDLKSQ